MQSGKSWKIGGYHPRMTHHLSQKTGENLKISSHIIGRETPSLVFKNPELAILVVSTTLDIAPSMEPKDT